MPATATISDQAVEKLSGGGQGTNELIAQVTSWGETLDTYSMTGLLPLAVAILIFAEMNASITESRVVRVGWLLWRVFGFMALLAGYGKIVSLLTGLGGGAAGWPDTGIFIAPLEYGLKANLKIVRHTNAWNLGETLGPFLIWLPLFAIDCMTALFAYIVVTAMEKIQAILLIIFIASGKTCLIISIVPGIGIAKSWAKVVASVAAWSFMAGIVFAATDWHPNSKVAAVGANAAGLPGHIMLWTQCMLMGIFGLAIPKLVGALASGSMGAAPGIGAALGAAMLGGKLLNSSPGTLAKGAKGTGRTAKAAGNAGKWAAGKYDAGKARLGKMARIGSSPNKGAGGAPKPGEAVNGIKSTRKDGKASQVNGSEAPKPGEAVNGIKSTRKDGRAPQINGSESPKPGGNGAINREKGAPDWHNRPEWSQSKDQWKDQGWSDSYDESGNSLINSAKPKAREGHTPHLIQSGFNVQGNPQKFRWEQVPNEKAGDKFPWRGDDWGNKSFGKTAAGVQAPKAGEAPSPQKGPKSKNAVSKTGKTNAGNHVARGKNLRVQSKDTLGNSGLEKDSDSTKAKNKSRPRRGGKQER